MTAETAAPLRDPFKNPFPESDTARRAIWEMLVPRDITAYLAADWSIVADDFVEANFTGMNGNRDENPQNWSLSFASLEAYRNEWLRQAKEGQGTEYAEDARTAIFTATKLEEIEIDGSAALVRKKFDGRIQRKDGGEDRLLWQTLYICRETADGWKIAGFVGYLPYEGH
ncbi:hypothetical protein SAMN06297129_1341 [Pseudooceanicola antarcticus]|uniref:SnoaL-like domain-containing protein n=1 Tax=Pseudooceanicola antarcticus TaxID=1247613 RepID=A0A285IM22_9RHOB|nr:hypothetical protein [Pseudooceanicola antarcticus]PJE28814.1 hypothetical protein CVM39_10140 [Pseudooceanicola antarcticus]SNY48156.1 hypothetical protein SAMN06297129_1341 [Pseudooceanicola antarcticus]